MKQIILIAMIITIMSLFMTGCIEPDAQLEPASTIPEVATYENPIPLGRYIIYYNDGERVELMILEIERGSVIYDEYGNHSWFHAKPKTGCEYMVVKIHFRYKDGSDAITCSEWDFEAYSNSIKYGTAPWVNLGDEYPMLESITLMPGGSFEKWIVFQVPINDEVIIEYEYGHSDLKGYLDAGSGEWSYMDHSM